MRYPFLCLGVCLSAYFYESFGPSYRTSAKKKKKKSVRFSVKSIAYLMGEASAGKRDELRV